MYKRVSNHPFLCYLTLYFSGSFPMIINFPDEIPKKDDRFYKTIHQGVYDEADPYFSSGSFNFAETYSESDAGGLYRQQATFRFPSNDVQRAQRIESYRKVKYLGLHLTDGSELIMGRNDIDQNRAPAVQINSGVHLTEVKLTTESIQPVILVRKTEGGGSPLLGYDYTYNFELS